VPLPEIDGRATDARPMIAVDDRDDEPRMLVAQRRTRRGAMEAERGPEGVRLRLVRATARSGEPNKEEKDP